MSTTTAPATRVKQNSEVADVIYDLIQPAVILLREAGYARSAILAVLGDAYNQLQQRVFSYSPAHAMKETDHEAAHEWSAALLSLETASAAVRAAELLLERAADDDDHLKDAAVDLLSFVQQIVRRVLLAEEVEP